MSHAAIYADILACDETSLVGTEIQYHIGYVHWIADTSCGLLNGIRAFIDGIVRVNPAR